MNLASTSPDIIENNIYDDAVVENEELERYDYDSFSATSTTCTSCSYISYNMRINDTQLFVRPIQGHTADCLEHTAASNIHIGSISVQNGTDVTFGNKTIFNAPVVIKQLVVDYGDVPGRSEEPAVKPKLSWMSRIHRFFNSRPITICFILTALIMIVSTSILVVYFLDLFGEKTTCEEIPSGPTHYTCGYASACTRCKAIFPDKDICQGYYEQNCGDLRCFCKPECRSKDCHS